MAEFMVAGVYSLVPDMMARLRSREQNWQQDWALVLKGQPLAAPPSRCAPSSTGFTNPSNRATSLEPSAQT